MANQVYGYIVERIVEAVTAGGLLPWMKPWKSTGLNARSYSGHHYRGIDRPAGTTSVVAG